MKKSLFKKNHKKVPLAERMRPKELDQFLGQEELVGEDKPLRKLIEKDEIPSMILWGPPGSGKTTLAQLIALKTKSNFIQFSAVTSGVKELKRVIDEALKRRNFYNQKTILFIDEIHRWNKAQQDTLLPYLEKGIITLIGATTENPSFEINSALLSRCKVFVLRSLTEKEIEIILKKALKDKEKGLGDLRIRIEERALKFLTSVSDGDARVALNGLEMAVDSEREKKIIKIDLRKIKEVLQKSHLLYDKKGEEHYNLISALHKSMRGSDPQAALYWLVRMLEAGEDPLYIARRLVRFASEDIGLADPQALLQAVAAYKACHFVGLPECRLNLVQAVVYLSLAPKSNELYLAYNRVQKDVFETRNDSVPLHLRNPETPLMKALGYGKNYIYSPSHNYQEKQEYLPENLKGKKYIDLRRIKGFKKNYENSSS